MVSVYPCDAHGKRIPAKLDWLRLTMSNGAYKWTRPMRLCRPCLDQRVATVGAHWTSISLEDDRPVDELCCSCSRSTPVSAERYSLFATAFREGERLDWFGFYCPPCANQLIQDQRLLAYI